MFTIGIIDITINVKDSFFKILSKQTAIKFFVIPFEYLQATPSNFCSNGDKKHTPPLMNQQNKTNEFTRNKNTKTTMLFVMIGPITASIVNNI